MTWEVDNYNGYPNVAQLNKIFSAIQDIADQGLAGPPGSDGADGVDGTNGWSPVLAIETDLEARYLKVVDWVGGTGTKPLAGLYVSSTGLSASIDDAIDIRGPQGEAGVNGEDGSAAPNQFVDLIDTPDTLGTNGQVLSIGLDAYANPEITWSDPEAGGASTFVELEDTPSTLGTDGQVLTVGLDLYGIPELTWADPQGGGASTLLDLTDTPSTAGVPGQYLAVTPYGTFDYADPVDPVTTEDILPSYTGNASKMLAVNTAESGVEWVEAPSGGGGGGGTFGTWTPTFTNFSGSELVTSRGFYYDLGDMVFISLEVILDATTASQVVINNLPVPVDDTSYEYSVALALSPRLNDPVPGNAVGAWLNMYNGRIHLITATGGIAVSKTTERESFSISGWYKKATT
jgi:hypothetical protein